MLYEPVKRLTGIHNIFQQALGASQKVFEYLDHAEEIQEKPGAAKLARFSERDPLRERHLPLSRLSPDGFRWRRSTWKCSAGEVVALVGPSGAGKTTLANLVPRFYDVTAAPCASTAATCAISTWPRCDRKIGIVAQDTFLFNDTVANNIAYGRPDTPVSEIREAARNALARRIHQRLPEGYDTMIGERGVKLSGGQRQRIAIARALLKNAPDPDPGRSHFAPRYRIGDAGAEAPANLMADRTVIVIAHRLSTIRRADKIVVLERGRSPKSARTKNWSAGGGIYQRLHELQFVEAAERDGPMSAPQHDRIRAGTQDYAGWRNRRSASKA